LSRDRLLDGLGLAALYGSVAAVAPLVPDTPLRHLGEPSYQALIALLVTAVAIGALRASGRRGSRLERIGLAVFLAGMPLVYVGNWILSSGHAQPWLAVELTGFALFTVVAIVGVYGPPWVLAAGIVLHGLAWDLWHRGTVDFVEPWYATGCLIADLGLGLYAATQARAYAVSAR
jgi:hypothetical protein